MNKNCYYNNMDEIITMTLISHKIGSILSSSANSMAKQFSFNLSEEPSLRLHVANISDSRGNIFPAYVEANSYGFSLYTSGERKNRVLLQCIKTEDGNFDIVDGELASEVLGIMSL